MRFSDLKYEGQRAWPPNNFDGDAFNGGASQRVQNDTYSAVLLEATLSPDGHCIELKTSLGSCDLFVDNVELVKVLNTLKRSKGMKLADIGDVVLDK